MQKYLLLGKLFVAGGYELSSAESFDPREGKWSMIPSMYHKRYASGIVALDDCLYAIGEFHLINKVRVINYFHNKNN